jgi:hypothetical protein
LKKVAPGYYAIIPQDVIDTANWRLTIEGTAAGIAAAQYGGNGFTLMGISAARLLGGYPRALSFAIVGSSKKRAPMTLTDGAKIEFVKTNLSLVDAEMRQTDAGWCLVTSAEQPVLDIEHCPQWGGTNAAADEAIRSLWPQCDPTRLSEVAAKYRRRDALNRLRRRFGDSDAAAK